MMERTYFALLVIGSMWGARPYAFAMRRTKTSGRVVKNESKLNDTIHHTAPTPEVRAAHPGASFERTEHILSSGQSATHDSMAKFYRDHPFPAHVVESFNSLKTLLTNENVPFVVQELPGHLILEEHGFDVVQRFVAKTFIDVNDQTAKTAMLQWIEGKAVFTITEGEKREDYTVENDASYAPLHLIRGRVGNRLVSLRDIACMSPPCIDEPLDLQDGWGMFNEQGRGLILDKQGDLRTPILEVLGRPQELGKDLVFTTRSQKLLLPKENPVSAFKAQDFIFAQGEDNMRRLVRRKKPWSATVDFIGDPIDYEESFLLNRGNGFQLVSKSDFDHMSNLLTEAPTREEGKDHVTVQEGATQRVVSLNNPSEMSPPFHAVIQRTKQLQVVVQREPRKLDRYYIFSPKDPHVYWGPYTYRPKIGPHAARIVRPGSNGHKSSFIDAPAQLLIEQDDGTLMWMRQQDSSVAGDAAR